MDDEAEESYCCITDLRCRLCQFGLEKDDPVVACMPPAPSHTQHSHFAIACSHEFIDIDGGQRLSYFPFHPYESHQDTVLHIRFHTCRSGCHLGDFCAPLFHRNCFEFQSRLHAVTPRLLASTAYTFQPSTCETRRRSNLIQSRLVPKLSQALPARARLPAEMLTMIANLLVRECAIVTAQEQALPDALPSSFIVDLTQNVYAQYLDIDGFCHVKSLQNSKSETVKKQALLPRAQEDFANLKIFVAEDHLGIRAVHFASSSRMPETSLGSGVWWKCISRRHGNAKIRVTTDVSRATASSGCNEANRLSDHEIERHQRARCRLCSGRPHPLGSSRAPYPCHKSWDALPPEFLPNRSPHVLF